MLYWWVNQNQTAKHEIGGSYLWSPKRNRNDSYNQFYENMRLPEPGDIVFSFYDQHIQHLGVVQSRAVTAPKPTEFAGAALLE
jgi:putative restriction endonuclease